MSTSLILRAANNDPDALRKIVAIYQPYIVSLCKYKVRDRKGYIKDVLDRDMKFELEQALMEKFCKFNPYN